MDVNTTQKLVNDMMKRLNLESISADEEMYDPQKHEIASYSDAKGMKEGIIIKTIKKGYKLNGEIVKKTKSLCYKIKSKKTHLICFAFQSHLKLCS